MPSTHTYSLPEGEGNLRFEGAPQLRTMASSLSGQKRSQPEVEAEVDPSCCCAVCFEVLLDPVTLPCGHSLDQRCLQKVVAAASGGTGHLACPTCKKAIPTELPDVNVQMRTMMQRFYPAQVRRGNPNCPFSKMHGVHRARVGDAAHGDTQVDRRHAEVSKEAAH